MDWTHHVARLQRNTRRVYTLLQMPGQLRHMHRWLASFRQDYTLKRQIPWLTFDAIAYLSARVAPGWRVFEYGSGGSTLFWLNRGCEIVSIEHDELWYAQVQRRLNPDSPIDYRLVPPEPGHVCEGESASAADPRCYRSASPQFAGVNFWRYVRQIDEFPDQYFDLVLVDGRARASCVVHSASKVKAGGLLILDNAERPYYLAQTQSALSGFAERRFPGLGPGTWPSFQTNIYVRLDV